MQYRRRIILLLREENKLMEIVKLIGADVLPDDQKLIIDIAKIIRVGFLQQNAYHKDDTYVPLKKQFLMMKTIVDLYETAKKLITLGKPIGLLENSGIYEKIIKMKYDIPNDRLDMFDDYGKEIVTVIDELSAR